MSMKTRMSNLRKVTAYSAVGKLLRMLPGSKVFSDVTLVTTTS